MYYALTGLLILGGILAISNLIVAKKPQAKDLIDKLLPFQAIIGVGLLALGIWSLLALGGVLRSFSFAPISAVVSLAMMGSAVLLGFMFGMPQIAKWIPGEGAAEQKGMALSKKLAPFQVIIGLGGLGSAVLRLLHIF